VRFSFSEEQDALREAVRSFFERKSAHDEVRRLMMSESGYDEGVWRQMATGLGLQGLAIPEEFGGAGATFAEVAVVLEEAGRSLLCAPYFATVVLAANALALSGDRAAQERWLPRIASGELVATVAHLDDSGQWNPAGIAVTASRSGDEWLLNGTKRFVVDGLAADLIVVAARVGDGISLFAVEGGASGLERAAQDPMDLTRRLAIVSLADVPAVPLGTPGDQWGILERVLQLGAIGLAAEQAGGAQYALEMVVRYAKEREQFGKPIGAFQAVKHKAAEMLLDVESARSIAYYAAACATAGDGDLQVAASLAKSFCSEAYFRTAASCIQLHGGIGFTWEHPAHLYFRRAKSSEIYLGDGNYHRDVLASRLDA
jgi:alkylation response protein AidB-like acyl-CoA dehydrogenase